MIKPKSFSLTNCWTLHIEYFIGWCSKKSTLNLNITGSSNPVQTWEVSNKTTSGGLLYCHESNYVCAFAVTQQTCRQICRLYGAAQLITISRCSVTVKGWTQQQQQLVHMWQLFIRSLYWRTYVHQWCFTACSSVAAASKLLLRWPRSHQSLSRLILRNWHEGRTSSPSFSSSLALCIKLFIS